jgi:hypothetical protein
MKLPPHRFTIGGKLWHLRYGDPTGDILDDPEDDYGVTVWSERLIYLSAELRLKKNRAKAWETFAHELLHALDPEMTHYTIKRLEGPLGEFLAENGFSDGAFLSGIRPAAPAASKRPGR